MSINIIVDKPVYQHYFKKFADGRWMEVIVEMDDETNGHVVDAQWHDELPEWTKNETPIYLAPECP